MYNSDMNTSKNIIKVILKEKWDEFKLKKGYKLPKEIRKDIYEAVEKSMYCGEKANGYAQYICLDCGNTHSIGFSCKSKACLKCGIRYSLDWAEKQYSKTLNIGHSHITFTIPSELRIFFYSNRELLKEMQNLTFECIKYYYQERLGKGIVPGVIAVLHTFGDDLKWNPHIHTIVTQGAIDKKDKWVTELKHIPYEYLRKSWQKLVLDLLKSKESKTKAIISKMYAVYPKGFYVNVEKSIRNIRHTIKYLGRYLGRYPISNKRILNYDGDKVTYTYKEKTSRKKFILIVDVLDFIGKLVQHLNKKHFKCIKRYGLYSRRSNNLSIHIINLFNFIKQRSIKALLSIVNKHKITFRERLIMMFNIDIIRCKICKSNMELYKICIPKIGTIYHKNIDSILRNPKEHNLITNDLEQLVLF